MIGDPKKDSLLLTEASPALHTDKIKTPLFIAQGANDPRVNKAESDQMVEAFFNQDNQFDFYGAMEKFLDKHLQPQE